LAVLELLGHARKEAGMARVIDSWRIEKVRELSHEQGNPELVTLVDDVLDEREPLLEFLHDVVQRLGRHPKLAGDRDPSGDGLVPRIQQFLGLSDKIT
jgi:hypothetical protein